MHRPTQSGISGTRAEGADSIVVSGGYEDDEDYGDLIVYTGAGGRDPQTGQQIADQDFTAQNLALVTSEAEGLPVRVTRGPFEGARGYLTRVEAGKPRLVVAIEWVNRAVSVEIDARCVERDL